MDLKSFRQLLRPQKTCVLREQIVSISFQGGSLQLREKLKKLSKVFKLCAVVDN